MRSKLLILGIAFLSVSRVYGQSSTGGSSSSSSSSPSSSSGSPGSATIENQMIAYEVLRQMAGQIADEVAATRNQMGQMFCTATNPGAVLLADPSAQFQIAAYKSFKSSAAALTKAYNTGGGGGGGAASAEAFADVSSSIASLLGAIKNTATYSNQNFQPTTQSMTNLLSLALKNKNYALRTVALPGDIEAASDKVQDALNEISRARAGAIDATRTKLDPEFTALRTALVAATPDGTLLASIIKGRALLTSLKGEGNEDDRTIGFCILTVSVDAAGGDTRTTHWFLQELVMPTPRPSYNGGAVVSFTLTDKTGTLLAGDMFHYMYGFSKWSNPKVPKTYNSSPPK
jgi:hypothetical protein